MLKVCHVTNVHTSTDTRIFYKECVSLAKAGYEVYLVAPGASREERGVHVIGLGERPASRLTRMTGFARKAYETALGLECALYHLHDPELLPYGVKLKRRGKTVVFDSHENTLEEMDEKTWLPPMLRGSVAWMYRQYASRVFSKVDALISVTPHLHTMLQALNGNTVMITNYSILREAPSPDSPRDPHAVCFAGGINAAWNHGAILRALESVPEATYALCGTTTEAYLATLQKEPAWNRVSYLGMLTKAEVQKVYAAASVGMALCAYSKNTFGKTGTLGNTKLFEYMEAGLAVICTDFTLWQEITARYHCGLCVDPTDVAAIAEAIRYLLDHPDAAQEMGENGRRAVAAEYNWGVEEKKLLALYARLMRPETC